MKKNIIIFTSILLLATACNKSSRTTNTQSSSNNSSTATSVTPPPSTPNPAPKPAIVQPISDASSRITKKFFGTYVTPQNSPVQPERFTGYHTGLDFETFPNEQSSDVPINVLCAGKILRQGYATGYGGYAVQSCTINDQAVTVVYGHLRESSISTKVGQELSAGDHLAVLGTGYSTETDGERKHLHLGIHIGTTVNILGYVQTKSALSGWLDPQKVLGL